MKRILATASMGLLLSGMVPFIPQEMHYVASYQGPYASQFETETVCEAISSSTPCSPTERLKRADRQLFHDRDGNGIVSWSKFATQDGEEFLMQIPDEQYARMGQATGKNTGINAVPQAAELISILQSLIPTPAEAAIAFDAAAGTQDNGGGATSISWTQTNTGSNTYLAVCSSITQSTSYGVTFTGATYNGVAMTSLTTANVDNGGDGDITVIAYGLAAPATGSNTVQVNISGTLDSNKQFAAQSQSYTGVQQTGQPDSTGSNSLVGSSVTTFTVSDTVVATSWLIGCASEDQGDIAGGVAGSGTTYRGSARFNLVGADSNGDVAAGARTLNWGRAGTPGQLVGIVVALTPAAAAGGSSTNFWQFEAF